MEVNLFIEGVIFFDYGCGYGEDIKYIVKKGYLSVGWDFYYLLEIFCIIVDVVNFGYVINVIEFLVECREVLIKFW